MAKVCDMGLYDLAQMGDVPVTRATYFVAPEMAETGKGVAQTDVYSFGILMWYLLRGYCNSRTAKPARSINDPTNYDPYQSKTATEFMKEAHLQDIRPEVDQLSSGLCQKAGVCQNAVSVLKSCWARESSHRWGCGRLKHEFGTLTEQLTSAERKN